MKAYIAPIVAGIAVAVVAHKTPWVIGFYPLIVSSLNFAISSNKGE